VNGNQNSPLLVAPFVLLLFLIATMPLTQLSVKHFWDKYYRLVSVGLGVVVAVYYLVKVSGGSAAIAHTLGEYFSFIALVGSLFVVAGAFISR
jgi:uncharacterized membrane protein